MMEILGSPASRFKGQHRPKASFVIDHLHGTVLFHPQFANDYVVHAAVHICPSICFAPPFVPKYTLMLDAHHTSC